MITPFLAFSLFCSLSVRCEGVTETVRSWQKKRCQAAGKKNVEGLALKCYYYSEQDISEERTCRSQTGFALTSKATVFFFSFSLNGVKSAEPW